MPVTNTPRNAGPFIGDGVATLFPFNFRVFAAGDLLVQFTTGTAISIGVLGVDYTIALNADQTNTPGGVIVSTVPLPIGTTLSAVGNLPFTQTAALPQGGNYSAIVVQNALDRTVMLVQQLAEKVGRAFRLSPGETVADLPAPASRAGFLLGFDGSGALALISSVAGSASALALSLLSTAGGTFVSFLQAGVGAVLRTLQDELRDTVKIQQFGGVADGNVQAGTGTDNAPALQRAITKLGGAGAVYLPPGVYRFASQVTVPAGVTIYGAGKYCSIITVGNSFNSDGVLKCNGIGGVPTNIRGIGVIVQNGGAGASSKGINSVANGVFIDDVWVSGFNVNTTLGSSDNFLTNSAIEEPAAGGTCVEITSTDVTVDAVTIYHGYIGMAVHDIAYSDGTVSITNVRYNACTYESILVSNANNVQFDSCSVGGSNVGQNAHAAVAVAGSSNIVFTNLIARTAGGPSTTAVGFDLTGAGNSNIVVNGAQLVGWLDGLSAAGVSGLVANGVVALNSYRNGFSVAGGDRVNLGNCQAINDGSAGAATDAGFKLTSTDGSAVWTVTGCTATQNGGGLQDFGFDVSLTDNGANTGTIALTGNTGRFNAVSDLRLQGAVGSIRMSAGNSFGTSAGGMQTIGAVAGMTLPTGQDTIGISGNGTITSIAPSWPDRVVRLVFTATAGVQDGGNLKLAGNFTGTADDVLTLVCDGTNWYEVSRSVN